MHEGEGGREGWGKERGVMVEVYPMWRGSVGKGREKHDLKANKCVSLMFKQEFFMIIKFGLI